MARGKDERHNLSRKTGRDLLASHGMSAMEQHGAVMRASAVPASDFEGEYEGAGTYTSPSAQMLSRVMWESRMRKSTGIPKINDEEN